MPARKPQTCRSMAHWRPSEVSRKPALWGDGDVRGESYQSGLRLLETQQKPEASILSSLSTFSTTCFQWGAGCPREGFASLLGDFGQDAITSLSLGFCKWRAEKHFPPLRCHYFPLRCSAWNQSVCPGHLTWCWKQLC